MTEIDVRIEAARPRQRDPTLLENFQPAKLSAPLAVSLTPSGTGNAGSVTQTPSGRS